MEGINVVGAIIGAVAGIISGGLIGRVNIYSRINKSNLFGTGENPEMQKERGNTISEKVLILFVAIVFGGIGIFCLFFAGTAMEGATSNVSGPMTIRVFGGLAIALTALLLTAVFKKD